MARASIDVFGREYLTVFNDSARLEWERKDFIFQGEMFRLAVEICKTWGWPAQASLC
jgi:hypothetical protein